MQLHKPTNQHALHCLHCVSHRIEGTERAGTWWIVSVNSAEMHYPLHTCADDRPLYVVIDVVQLPWNCLVDKTVYTGNSTRELHTRLQVVYVEMSLKPSPNNVVQKLLLQYKQKSSQLLHNVTSWIKRLLFTAIITISCSPFANGTPGCHFAMIQCMQNWR